MDEKLVASLRSALGLDYEVSYPRMPGEDDPVYFAWKPAISAAIAVAGDGVTLVGHSVGGASLLKYLVEEPLTQRIAGLFLIAAPAWDGEQWAFEDLRLPKDAASRLKPIERIHFYHCQDDTTVPFAHLALHAQRIPQANTMLSRGAGISSTTTYCSLQTIFLTQSISRGTISANAGKVPANAGTAICPLRLSIVTNSSRAIPAPT